METKTSERYILLISIFVAGLCSIIYELLIGTTSSYFFGDSVKQFSITVGVYMAAMGLGSYLSRFIEHKALESFIIVEIILAFFGGISVPVLYVLFSIEVGFMPGMVICLGVVGILTGFEIPLLSRILSGKYSLKENLSNVLSLDYIGALIATLAFPFFIIPFFGIFKSSLIFGLINLGIGVLNIIFLSAQIQKSFRPLLNFGLIVIALFLSSMLFFSNSLLSMWEQGLYSDRIIYTKQSQFQKIVVTKHKDDLRLFLDGNLQFSSLDEYRYHEVLVHIPIALSYQVENVLILGGGDGLAVRELLKYEHIHSITLVDLDQEVSRVCTDHKLISQLNQSSLQDSKVNLIHGDAFGFIRKNEEKFDLIICDLPDPNNTSLARLYSREYYHWLRNSLSEGGVFITQAGSPVYSNKAFWCIRESMTAGGFDYTYPLHAYIPTFGDWGFVIGSSNQLNTQAFDLLGGLKFLNPKVAGSLFHFAEDEKVLDIVASTLDKPTIHKYYDDSWKKWK